MKKTLFAVLAAFALTTSLFYFTSCEGEDLCANVDCGPHGTCNSTTGVCDCAAGYEIDLNGRCDIQYRQKFIGTYEFKDKAETAADTAFCTETYTSVISEEGTNPSKIVISNFAGSATKFTATISSKDSKSFTIDSLQKVAINSVFFEGSGSGSITSDGVLTLKYKFVYANSGKTAFSCSASGKKK